MHNLNLIMKKQTQIEGTLQTTNMYSLKCQCHKIQRLNKELFQIKEDLEIKYIV